MSAGRSTPPRSAELAEHPGIQQKSEQVPIAVLPALTGLRAAAAAWVLIFHYRDFFIATLPGTAPLRPLMEAGYLGVDLFFALSGFVLAHNYADALRAFRWRAAVAFLQNRLARIYPVHLVTLHVALAMYLIANNAGINIDSAAGPEGVRYTDGAYLQNLLLIQTWFDGRLSFNGVAWSVSAEWAAYLGFPVLAVAAARWVRGNAPAVSVALAAYALLLLAFWWQSRGGESVHQGQMLRLACGFIAGFALQRAVGGRSHQLLGKLCLPLVIAIAALLMMLPDAAANGSIWVAPALGLLVACLAGPGGTLWKLLSTRLMTYGGELSYSLYMVHVLVAQVVNATLLPANASDWSLPARIGVVLAYLSVPIVCAMVMLHAVERPCRRYLRARNQKAVT